MQVLSKYTNPSMNVYLVGCVFFTIQVYELYNGGAVPVKYEIDTTALQILQAESYDHPIFEVIIQCALLLCIFS